MPKILRILNRLNVGGPTYNVAYLSKYLDPSYQTKVLAGFKEPHEGSSEYVLNDLGIDYEFVPDMFRPLSPVQDYKAFKSIQRSIKEFRPDIVHTHAAKAGALGRTAAFYSKEKPKAIIHTYHGNVFDGYFSPLKTKLFLSLEQYFCRLSTAIIAISEAQKADLVEKYKIAPAEKIHVIRLGFDLSKFERDRDVKRKTFRSGYNVDDQTIVVSITGRLAPVKNHTLFINAVSQMKKKCPQLKIKYFIVGNGESFEDIVLLIKSLGLSCCLPDENNFDADIIFTSWRKDIDVINAGSDIVALTSINEGTPVSIIEALASNKAVICTNVGGVKDVVTDEESGLLCKPDTLEFSEKIYRLAVDAHLRKRLAAEGEKFVLKNYTYKRLVTDTELLYNSLLNR